MSTSRAFAGDDQAIWHPDERTIQRSRLSSLMRRCGEEDISQLHGRAIEDPEFFWREVIDHLDIRFEHPFTQVLDSSQGKEFPKWFTDGTVNLAANCLDRYIGQEAEDKTAVIWESESGESRSLSYAELYGQSVRFARYLRSVGVGPGDRVALYLPMIPETAAVFLGCARIGAVVVPGFSGYGPDAMASRIRESNAAVLVTADGFRRKGSVVQMKVVADKSVAESSSVRAVVVIPHLGLPVNLSILDILWEDALTSGDNSDSSGECVFLDPNHPLMILYTSGTSGKPKGTVHSHGGFLVKSALDFGYGFDIQDDDIVCWITDLGWLMGPLLIVASLLFHATAVFYEGVPDFPDPGNLWRIVERHGVTFLGISPTAVRNLVVAGNEWVGKHRLDSLRAIGATGEPWNEGPWRWLFEVVGGRRIPILNYSGGTEIGGGILICYTILPLKPCAFSGPVLGMDVDVVDENGESVRGTVGELVIRNVWPGMTHGFFGDPQRYLEAYWDKFPGVWVHGDLVSLEESGYWYVNGRSDDTIKLAGKRVGPAEVESALVGHPAVEEAAAAGMPDEIKGQQLVCFVVLAPGAIQSDELEREIAATVAEKLGKALTPKKIVFVKGLPKTRNGKVMRRTIRARYLGLSLGDLSSLDSLDSLELIPERGES